MKRLVILSLFVCLFSALPASAQSFTAITDAPQHAAMAGFGCDGNRQCSADFGWAEKVSGATYSFTAVEVVPNLVTLPTGARTVNLKTIPMSGVEQIIYQQGRLTAILGAAGGAALPTANSPTFNFTSAEHATLAWRLNKSLNATAGGSNNYLAVTPYFTQIAGVPNGNTAAVRLHFIHSIN